MANKYSTVAIFALAAAAIMAAYSISISGFGQMNAIAQTASSGNSTSTHRVAFTYLETKTVTIPTTTNGTAIALCQKGDSVVSGGYSMGFGSVSVYQPNTILVSNTPVHIPAGSSKYEGWQAGLANIGGSTVTLTSEALCIGVKVVK